MKVRVPQPDQRFIVFACQRTLESISATEIRIKVTSFGCNGQEHHKEVLHETYDSPGSGNVIDVESIPTELHSICDGTCAGNIDQGSKGWFVPHE